MSSSALESQGMQLKVGDGASPETFTAIPEITSLSGPDGSASEIDVSDLSSTAREFRMGLKDSGSVSIEGMFIPANTVHAGLRTDWSNRTLRNFEMHFTDSPATVWEFSAYVQNLSISNGVDGVTTFSATLRISGDVTEQ